ncbi:MAG: FAD-dependent oxidoreductase [Eubacteriales bacterium]|nr:FAD-dependent oxidoreductase [Eubacteriales bacterium]
MKNLSRRQFLKSGAAVAAAGLIGSVVPAVKAGAEEPGFDREVDVLIIGGGGTGVAAACEAAEAGAEVLVVEKLGFMGGSTLMSGGMIHAWGTDEQAEFTGTTDDSAELMFQYYKGCGGTYIDDEVCYDMCEGSHDDFLWCKECGINYVTVFGVPDIPGLNEYIRPRIHLPGDETSGTAGIPGLGHFHVDPIWARAQAAGAVCETNTAGKKLLTNENGAVIGAIVEKDGQEIRIKARKGVVLATSGYDHNLEMAKGMSKSQYIALTEPGNIAGSCVGNTGDGIRMGMEVGAGLAGIGGGINVSLNGSIGRDPTSNIGGCTTGISVNKYGQRFVDEWCQYGYYMNAVFNQDDHISWTVTDQAAVDREGGTAMGFTSEDLSADVEAGSVVKADTIEELAEAIGVSAEGLKSTLATWNADCAKGVDTAFGKTQCLNPIEVGPFYAAKTQTYNLGTLGGLKINTDAQVCRFDGTPIEHLYAGGLCSGGWAGLFYPGSGTAVLSTVHWGRKAGRNAAANEAL